LGAYSFGGLAARWLALARAEARATAT
jgi:hypothetical protein